MRKLCIEPLAGEGREAEGAAWRAIVRRELGAVEISYNETGAPIVSRENRHIGVAHCRGWVAVVVSDAPCAVDIEPNDRDFSQVMTRVATPEEQHIPPILIWTGKETLYKFSGRTGLDFRRDLRLVYKDGALRGCICGGPEIPIAIHRTDDYTATVILS